MRIVAAAALCVILWPAAAAAQFQAVNWPAEGPPRPLAPRQMNFPPYEMRRLANGMQVIAVAQNEQPAVTMRLLIGAGSAQDPARKSGTARLVASVLDQGTTSMSAAEVADRIDSIGGSMGTGSGTDLSNVYAVVMKDSFDVAMNLLSDVVRNPAFAPEEIDRQKQQALSSLQVNAGDPDYVASVVFDRLVYGFHPYGVTTTPQSLASITRADLQSFHRQYFVPNNMILAVVGDITATEAFAMAEKAFGGMKPGDVATSFLQDPPAPTRRVIVVDKPDAVQTEIRVGQLAIPRKHPQYDAWDLAVKILGGEGANRLHRVLRSERGLTYGASADAQAMKQAGDYVAETDTETGNTGEVLRLMIDEFTRLPRQRVGGRELSDATAYLAGSFPLTLETPNDLATQLLNAVFYGLPVDDIRSYRERVQAITPDDILAVAKEYIRPDRLSIVLVGNAKAFLPQLRAQGFTEFEVIPIDRLDLSSATLTRAATDSAPPGSFGSFGSFDERTAYTATQVGRASDSNDPNDPNERARMLLARVVSARGGLERLKGVRTVVVEATTRVALATGELTTTTTTHVAYPDRFRVDARLGADTVVQVYNAGSAWEKSAQGIREAPPAMRDDWADSVRRDTIPLLIAASEGRLAARQLPDEIRPDGSRASVLELGGGVVPPVRFYVDDAALIVAQVFSKPGPNGRPLRSEEVFADHRLVDGIRVPFEATLIQNGRTMVTRRISKVTFNTPVSDMLFTRPQ